MFSRRMADGRVVLAVARPKPLILARAFHRSGARRGSDLRAPIPQERPPMSVKKKILVGAAIAAVAGAGTWAAIV